MKQGKITMVGDVEVYRIYDVGGGGGSRSRGGGWWARLPDGRFLVENQGGSSWPPYPVVAVEPGSCEKPAKTKREAVDLAERYEP